ncbi:MAG: dihydrolipoyllysine-residue acetyltransferase [Gammaproteobacteria bacterium]|nr:dihydrolipoyllysine-residue acetyltransferase [Gammaproteobacteria bacterium]
MEIEVLVPDIGDFDAVDVIDILVKPGDVVAPEDPLITLESDKATMDIPAPRGGRIGTIGVKIGDKIGEGARILTLSVDEASPPAASPAAAPPRAAADPAPAPAAPAPAAAAATVPTADRQAPTPPASTGSGLREVRVPDLGDFPEVDVIEILVRPGDAVDVEAPLLTLESDKATMDIPSPYAGTVRRVLVKIGDKVSTGTPIIEIEGATDTSPAPAPSAAPSAATPAASMPALDPAMDAPVAPPAPASASASASAESTHVYASPAIRRLARELGVDLHTVAGSGRKGRVQRDDVVSHVKRAMESQRSGAAPATAGGFALPAAPVVDFSRFGPVTTQPLHKLRKAIGQNLHRSWITIPHVTQFDSADITELEAFRKSKAAAAEAAGTKLTLVAFIARAVTAALAKFPDFNTSLAADGESLVSKQYCHLGIAANTPRGLVVPVVRDADRKGVFELAREIRTLGTKAREGKLTPAEMQGGCFTITSLGGISGTAFTPIINPPEVAILGVSPAAIQAVWRDGAFAPRLLLPLSLSYDHRVIDGVMAAEFTRFLGEVLGDIRELLL